MKLVRMNKSTIQSFEDWMVEIKQEFGENGENVGKRTVGEHGWAGLDVEDGKPTLTPHQNGPHFTDVYPIRDNPVPSRFLIGTYNHNEGIGKRFFGFIDT